MPQTIVETQSYPIPGYYAPQSTYVTLGKEAESPTGSDSGSDGLFTNGQCSKNSPSDGRETVDDKKICSLSLSTNNKDICSQENDGRVLDFDSTKLFNGALSSLINDSEDKEIQCSDSLGNSLPNNPSKQNNMGIVNDTESEILGDFTDLLSSISSPSFIPNGVSSKSNSYPDAFEGLKSNGFDHEFLKSGSKNSQGSLNCEDSYSRGNCVAFADYFTSFSERGVFVNHPDPDMFKEDPPTNRLGPELSKVNCKADSLKPNDNKLQYNRILSDIFLSIDINEDEPMQSKLNSYVPSDTNSFFDDMFLGHEAGGLKLYDSQKDGCVEDLFSVGDSTQSNLNSSTLSPDTNHPVEGDKVPIKNGLSSNFKQSNSEDLSQSLTEIMSSIASELKYPANDTPTVFNDISKYDSPNALLTSSVDFNFDKHRAPTSSMSVPKPTSMKSPHNQKNGEFSFFSVSPENMFSDMVSKLKKDADLQDNTTEDNSTGISMLDLFKSVNSGSSSSLSEYLSTESEGSWTDKKATETAHGLCEAIEIDLSSCLKTSNDTINNISSEEAIMKDSTDTRENDHKELQLGSFMIKAFPETVCSKHRRMNSKQGLLAKSLSYKRKMNPALLREVAKIKSELFEKCFNRPLPDIKAKKSFVKDSIISQSNDCMLAFHGRRVCSSNGLADVKGN